MAFTRPVCLIILDGWGYRENAEHNAIAEAKTPCFDALMAKYPHAFLDASEEQVGLPAGQIGNSEVGHMTMGAGRVMDVDLVKISKAARTGGFAENPAFVRLFDHVKRYHSTLHAVGLVGSGGVHSHQEHLHAFLRAAKAAGVTRVAIHAITDGRDLPPQSAAAHLASLEALLEELGFGADAVVSVHGRFYAMDRDKNWDRIGKSESAMFEGEAPERYQGRRPSEVLTARYQEGAVDEHLESMVFLDKDGMPRTIAKHDALLFFNFRPDRARQLTEKILARAQELDLRVATLTEYDKNLKTDVAFPQSRAETSLAKELSDAGLVQSHIAETEKYAHVTYFFDGGHETPYPQEHFFLIPSRKDIPTHDLAPEMRAKEIADKAIERIQAGDDFIVMNFANADMVGHTANRPAIVTAVETVDRELARVVDAVLAKGGAAVVTADHGNAEMNVDPETGERHTAHTLSVVPCIVVSPDARIPLADAHRRGSLADIAPTVLAILGIAQPDSMTGKSLV